MNGKHIPIFDGESKKDAINRSVAKQNEDTRDAQIAKYDKERDELSGKKSDKSEKSIYQKNAEALGLDYNKVKKDQIENYEKVQKEFDKLDKRNDLSDDEVNKWREMRDWLIRNKKSYEHYKSEKDGSESSKKSNTVTSKTGYFDDPEYDRIVTLDTIRSQYEKMVENDYIDPDKKSLADYAKDNFTELDEDYVKELKELGHKFPKNPVKSISTDVKKRPDMHTENGMSEVIYGKSFSKLSKSEKDNVTNAVSGYKEALDKIAKAHLIKVMSKGGAANQELYDAADKIAKANNIKAEWVRKDAFNAFNPIYADALKKRTK